MDYFAHNDDKGKTQRLALAVNRAERARMRATEQDSAWGLITLVMQKRELQSRLNEASLFGLGIKKK